MVWLDSVCVRYMNGLEGDRFMGMERTGQSSSSVLTSHGTLETPGDFFFLIDARISPPKSECLGGVV